MQNIASIYRFNTPFLDVQKEKGNILSSLEKIKNTIKLDGIYFQEKGSSDQNYTNITLELENDLGSFQFFYIKNLELLNDGNHYLPLFHLEIYFHNKFISTNEYRKNLVKFMESVFECFDGLNEKEFLIDLHQECYYKAGFFKRKHSPHYDFSDISQIQRNFNSRHGMKKLEDFIANFSGKTFILTNKTAKYYHEIHGIMLYFIYLVYIISRNLMQAKEANAILQEGITSNGNVELMRKRLYYVHNINKETFVKYKERLELFFQLF